MKPVYVFPGQGSQRLGMGKGLFDRFRDLVSLADDCLGYSIEDLCLRDPRNVLNQTEYTQPALYVVNALHYHDWLASGGEPPGVAAGHSLGEYSALYAAGAFDFVTGLRLVHKRGELMARAPRGAMAAVVNLDLDRVREILVGLPYHNIELANLNSRRQCALSGVYDELTAPEVRDAFVAAGASFILLNVGVGSHSRCMTGVQDEFARYLSTFELQKLALPVVANYTARPYPTTGDMECLIQQISKPVRWYESMSWLIHKGHPTFQEIGPGNVLSKLTEQIVGDPMVIVEPPIAPAVHAGGAPHAAAGPRSGAPDGAAAATGAPPRGADEPIAIVGLACRLPGAPDPAAYWVLLRDGVDAITEVPRDRWDIDALYDADPAAPGKMSTRWGGFLPQIDGFEPAFFGISPREAIQIDPQQRLALELAWEALEDAGIVPASLQDSRTGVFFGAMWMDYARQLDGTPERIALHTATGQDLSLVSARVSYALGLTGPSLTVNTASSSSLVAVHLACQSLARGESRLALAGGVNLMISPDSTIAMTKLGTMAPDGRSKAFDARANGYVRGEGGGVIALKRLSDARADGDRVYCVIRGSAINNDGFSNGLTAPSPRAQRALLADAYARARVAPSEVQYVEAHGTGTMLGDSIEVNALGAGLGAGRSAESALRIGSVKTNLGHLEAAAGIAGIIKVALAMAHRTLPPSLHFERPNAHIAFDALGVRVQTALAAWQPVDGRLLAGVSSFGFGGTNCHAVLEASAHDKPRVHRDGERRAAARLLVVSGRTPEAVRAQCARLAELDRGVDAIAYSLATTRSALDERVAIVASTRDELHAELAAVARGERPTTSVARARGKVAFVFSDSGSQIVGMGRELSAEWPVFRDAHDRALSLFADLPLREWMSTADAGDPEDAGERLAQAGHLYPAVFAVEYALAALWRSWGIEPELVAGHGLGELVAACVAGVFTLEDAARLVRARARWIDATLDASGAETAELTYQPPVLPLVSSLTGALAGPEIATSAYWVRHAREAMELADGVQALRAAGAETVVEIAAERGDTTSLLAALGAYWARGGAVAWAGVFPGGGDRIALPTCAWQRERYWLDAGREAVRREAATATRHDRAPRAPSEPIRASELAAMTSKRRADAVLAVVTEELARILSFRGPLPNGRPFAELGVDSIMAVELRDALASRLGRALPQTLAIDHPTVDALTHWLVHALAPAGPPAAEVPTAHLAPAIHDEPIAIVGLGARYPGGVVDAASYWKLLSEGIDAVAEMPPRWDVGALYDPNPEAAGKMATRHGGFVDGIDQFDPGFFGISPREAVAMDPQQRLLLETTWEALEHAGIVPERLAGTDTGVFVGLMYHDYATLAGGMADLDGYGLTGSTGSVASGRLSYVLGLNGPSLTVDTACSSSLVAIHLACRALRSGECSLTLAGGVALMLRPDVLVDASRLGALAPDGRCKSFAASADGVGWAEGCGMVVLKRQRDAERDGDRILALIRGTAVNQDGRSNGLTAPNGPSQQALIEHALRDAAVAPGEVGYVECHGTGTRLGDPIEVQALGAALAPGRTEPVVIGSVKSNLGHTQAAAGVAGVIKVVLALEHEQIPRSLHFDAPSPYIPWAELPVRVAHEPMAWPRGDRPRIAGVSSFGVSGTNAQAILQEPPPRAAPAADPDRARLFVVSARTEAALCEQCARLAARSDHRLGAVAYSLATTRSTHDERVAIVARTSDELRAALQAAAAGAASPGATRARRAPRGKLAFVFSGGGSQVMGMGRELYAEWPVFRDALDRVLAMFADLPLRELMWPADTDDPEGAAAQLARTAHMQPAVFAIDYALAALWRSWGVEPDLVTGHSLGELVAACIAGVLTLEDAARLVGARARLMQQMPAGSGMASIAASEAEVAAELAPGVSIAAVNGPAHVAIAGPSAAVAAMCEAWTARGVRARQLAVTHAGHSAQIDGILDALGAAAAELTYHPPALPLVSNLTGALAGPEIATSAYWVQHARQPVRFADGIRALHAAGVTRIVEVGARPALLAMIAECLDGATPAPVLVGSLRPGQPETARMLACLGEHWASGGDVAWSGVFPSGGERVPLPSYPWQRQRYWRATSIPDPDLASALRRLADDPKLSASVRAAVPELLAAVAARGATAAQGAPAEDPAPALAEAGGFLELAWDTAAVATARARGGRWLIIGDGGGLGASLRAALETAGHAVVQTAAGSLDRVPAGAWPIDETNPTEMSVLLSAAFHGRAPTAVVHLRSLDDDTGDAPALEPARTRVLDSVLCTLQALLGAIDRELPRLWLVTRGAQPTGGDVAVEQAPVVGLGRVIALEHPELRCTRLDLDPARPELEVGMVLAELVGDSLEQELALRGDQRRVARLARLAIDGTMPGALALRRDGSYLVTGGLGGLGLKVAGWLAARGAGHVVLVGRSGAASEAQQAAVAALAATGVRVTVAAADVSMRADIARVLDEIAASGMALRGVIHTAMVMDAGLLIQQTPERFRRVLAPKADGAWHLHELTRDLPLDLFVLFSSAAGLLGAPSEGNYAAANVFLDALAHHRKAHGLPALSVDWGAFSEVGRVAEHAPRDGRLAARGIETITPAAGLAALERALATGRVQVGFAAIDVRKWIATYPSSASSPMLSRLLAAHAAGPVAPRDLVERVRLAEPGERIRLVQDALCDHTAQVLRIPEDKLDIDAPLISLGMDSLMGLELRNRLEAGFRVRLSATLLWRYPTITAIRDVVLDELLRTAMGRPASESLAGRGAAAEDREEGTL